MASDKKIMRDHPEADTQPQQATAVNATLADALENAMDPLVKPFTEDRPDPEAAEQRRRAEDADERV